MAFVNYILQWGLLRSMEVLSFNYDLHTKIRKTVE